MLTGLGQAFFPHQVNGSILEVDGKKYATENMGQPFTDDGHLWGRIMTVEVATYTGEDGATLMYAQPQNLSPASDAYEALVAERVKRLQAANPEMKDTPIPVDLVTGSGSGLDPDISPAAAQYQVARIAKATGKTSEEVAGIITQCTTGKFLGVFGEETVNVLKVNLMLDGIIA